MAVSLDRRTLVKYAGGSTAVMLTGAAPIMVVAQEDAGAQTGELVIGKGQEAVGFDPALVTAASSFDLISVVYERLVYFDDNGEAQPELA
ncbi:MAG: hypothetical protein H0V98_05700, partial [Chloroflexia bacterium]|nr:hypothetical protein [Chloroflexia bacterium]